MGRKSKLKQERCSVVRQGNGSKTITLNDEAIDALKNQLESFRSTFGRDPIGSEPVFFDPDFTDKPTPICPDKLNAIMLRELKESGAPKDYLYAFEKTGMLVTKENEHMFSEDDLKEWNDSLEEYKGGSIN